MLRQNINMLKNHKISKHVYIYRYFVTIIAWWQNILFKIVIVSKTTVEDYFYIIQYFFEYKQDMNLNKVKNTMCMPAYTVHKRCKQYMKKTDVLSTNCIVWNSNCPGHRTGAEFSLYQNNIYYTIVWWQDIHILWYTGFQKLIHINGMEISISKIV